MGITGEEMAKLSLGSCQMYPFIYSFDSIEPVSLNEMANIGGKKERSSVKIAKYHPWVPETPVLAR